MLCLPPLLPPVVYHIGPHSSPSFLLLSPDPLHYCFPASNQVSRVVITFPSLLTVAHLPLATLCVCVFVFACLCVCVFARGGLWQGIDRSHSWVNSAYAPGGSRSVLRRNPNSSCDLKQVPNPSVLPPLIPNHSCLLLSFS